ncbi:type II toxin-antitoxin system VapC family toxin [Oscillatoria acuminata]|uniref:Putative nucleic acid-binding protein, contains PIN domain n=1 Tax=Oscillatoria acuminata PCC 6304 TaxID=56110 RepID=K9TTX0_9CYAN|nr:PIN domain-containing protein [Oscillatoria acuminata]AFY85459.1 putative nucleic acid-binding protein, contains PIN domain [Oscillatoria acuminata PCC 6304]
MRVLLDTNIILDYFLERDPFMNDAEALFTQIEAKQIEGYMTATTLTDIFYIVSKSKGTQVAKQVVSKLLDGLHICQVDRLILGSALALELNDFEDAVQIACAIASNLEAVISRDRDGFTQAPMPTYSPSELIKQLP